MISSLHNSDVHLGFGSLFSRATLAWFWQRRRGLLGQALQQIRFSRRIFSRVGAKG
ncbi:MAG: hypothetical protein AAGK00_04630 [Pseudomonadota bacterium]